MYFYCTVTTDGLQFTARAKNDACIMDAAMLYDTLRFKYGAHNVRLICSTVANGPVILQPAGEIEMWGGCM